MVSTLQFNKLKMREYCSSKFGYNCAQVTRIHAQIGVPRVQIEHLPLADTAIFWYFCCND